MKIAGEPDVCKISATDWRERLRSLVREDRSPRITVFILTYCRNPEAFYGTSLIFRTLRTGFPTAQVVVVDNASLPGVRREIRSLAASRECRFVQIPGPSVEHHEFLDCVTRLCSEERSPDRPLVFLDPDMCLWENCEALSCDGLIAGKLVGAFRCGITHSLTMPRLHTSFLWIPNPRALTDAVDRERRMRLDFEPFRPYSVRIAGRWCRFDTGASLLSAFPERVTCFSEVDLDRYDHIYSGSHAHVVFPGMEPRMTALLERIHEAARRGDLEEIRGAWRTQDEVFRALTAAV